MPRESFFWFAFFVVLLLIKKKTQDILRSTNCFFYFFRNFFIFVWLWFCFILVTQCRKCCSSYRNGCDVVVLVSCWNMTTTRCFGSCRMPFFFCDGIQNGGVMSSETEKAPYAFLLESHCCIFDVYKLDPMLTFIKFRSRERRAFGLVGAS